MLVNSNIIEELCKDAGEQRTQKANQYKSQGKVQLTKVTYEDKNNFEVHANVNGTESYKTYVEVKNGEIETIDCSCPDYYNTYGVCKHSLATLLTFNETGMEYVDNQKLQTNIINQSKKTSKYNSFNQ